MLFRSQLSNTISVIDLDSLTAVATIPTGDEPSNVAINTKTHQGIVTNRKSNDVSVFDTQNSQSLGKFFVGTRPRGVAIDEDNNRAAIVNSNSNDVWMIDLATRQVTKRFTVGEGPTAVAFHVPTNQIVVTNSLVTASDKTAARPSSVSIIDLAFGDVVSVGVGSAAFGVAVDGDNQRAIVADYGSKAITIIRIPNPVPRVSNVEPKTFPAGTGTFTIFLFGTGFLRTSVVTVNGQALPTAYISSSELHAQISSTLLDQILARGVQGPDGILKGTGAAQVRQLNFKIGVNNPGPGGGESPPPQDQQQQQNTQIVPQNATPVLLSISPTSAQTTSDLTLTLNGNNFNGTTIINFGSGGHSPASATSTSMTVVIPKAELVPGTVTVSATNPPPGGGDSAGISFTVIAPAQVNPSPAVTSVSPGSVTAGAPATTFTVTGTGFIEGKTSANLAGVSGSVKIGRAHV